MATARSVSSITLTKTTYPGGGFVLYRECPHCEHDVPFLFWQDTGAARCISCSVVLTLAVLTQLDPLTQLPADSQPELMVSPGPCPRCHTPGSFWFYSSDITLHCPACDEDIPTQEFDKA